MSDLEWNAKLIEGRVLEAAETLSRLPDKGAFLGFGSYWPQTIRDAAEAYGYNEFRVKIRPSGRAIDQMHKTWEWINALPDASDRRILYTWAWTKTRRGSFLNDFAAREGINSRTLRRQITAICQRIADTLNNASKACPQPGLAAVSEITAKTRPQHLASNSYATHYREDGAKPKHLPNSADHQSLIKRMSRRKRQKA